MRKIILMAVALSVIATVCFANPFASELRAEAKGAYPSWYELSFVLNESADSVIVEVMDGITLIKTIDAGALVGPGAHMVTWDKTDNGSNPVTGTYTFKVTCSNATGHTAWTQVSDDATTPLRFWYPRGIDIQKDMTRDDFGRMYVAEAGNGSCGGGIRVISEGIFILAADGSDPTNQGDTGYLGTIDFTGSDYSSPCDVDLDEEGNLFISDWSDGHSGVWIMDTENPTTAFSQLFGNDSNRDANGIVYQDGNPLSAPLHGSIQWIQAEGTGAGRVLYTIDEDSTILGQSTGSILKYEIGTTSSNYVTTPTIEYPDTDFGDLSVNGNTSAASELGGWWIAQYRWSGTPTDPCFWHYNGATIDFKDADPAVGTLVGPSSGPSYRGNIAIDPVGQVAAMSTYYAPNTHIYDMSDAPTTVTYVQDVASGGSNTMDLEFDPAGNLVSINANSEVLRVWSPPGASSFTTDSPASVSMPVPPAEVKDWYLIDR